MMKTTTGLTAMITAIDWIISLFQGHPGWYDPICSACGKRHRGRKRTDGPEYIEFNTTCPLNRKAM